VDWQKPIVHPNYSVPYQNETTCPRDVLLPLGNTIWEAPMSWRARHFEYFAYRTILNDYYKRDPRFQWLCGPRPTYRDSMFRMDWPWHDEEKALKLIAERKFVTKEEGEEAEVISNTLVLECNRTLFARSVRLSRRFVRRSHVCCAARAIGFVCSVSLQPVWDAADVMRFGQDLFVLHGFTTNLLGLEYMRRHFGDFRIHDLHFPEDYEPVHLDASLVPVKPPEDGRPGLIWEAPSRPVQRKYFPLFEPDWKIVEAPKPATTDVPTLCHFSPYLVINTLLIDPNTMVVEATERAQVEYLKSLGMRVLEVPFKDVYSFGGSFHCVTCDVRRRGTKKNYFPHLDFKDDDDHHDE
jgi:glycine amidinotransferase